MAAQCPPGVDCATDNGTHIAAIVSPLFGLAILSVLARLYSRYLTGHSGSASDFSIIAGLFLSGSLTGMVLYSPRLGVGRHVVTLPPDQVESLLLSLYVGCILYAITITMIKISILLLYKSLFPTPGIGKAIKVIGVITVAWGSETALVGVFSCIPVRSFWDLTVTQKKCINTTAFFIANSAVHVILDVTILTLPVRKVWALKMSLQKRVVVCFMFLLGGFICVIGVIRLVFLATLNMNDPSYSLVDTYIWSSIEANVGVICACLPTLRPVFMKLFPNSGLDSRPSNAPHDYFDYATDTHQLRSPRTGGNFERIDHSYAAKKPSFMNSKTAITVTHEVQQDFRTRQASMDSSG